MKIFWAIITVLTMFVGYDCSGKAMNVDKIWARATAVGGTQTTVYLTIENKLDQPDTLERVSTKIADAAVFVDASTKNGINEETPVNNIPVAKDETKVLRPLELYIKLTGLKQPLQVNDSFPITFYFTKGGAIDKTVHVEPPTATIYDKL